MPIQDMYFTMMSLIFGGMSTFSDKEVASTYDRLLRTFSLMNLRLSGSESLSVDQKGSGLPILKEFISTSNDIKTGVSRETSSIDIRNQMIDYILTRRKKPEDSLFNRLRRSIYSETIETNHFDWFKPDPYLQYEKTDDENHFFITWDYFDGPTCSPIHVRCEFFSDTNHSSMQKQEFDNTLQTIASNFSGSGFKLISLATEIDEKIQSPRLKNIRRLILGPLRSSIFTNVDDNASSHLNTMSDLQNSWIFSWVDENLRSSGTISKSLGIFKSSRPFENFYIDSYDFERKTRGVSDFQTHSIMPPEVYQIMTDTEKGKDYLNDRRVHILSNNELTEDV